MEKMQPEQVIAILCEYEIEVTVEEAKQILEFVYAMAGIAVSQCLRDEKEELKKTG